MQNFRQGEKFLQQKGRVLPLPFLCDRHKLPLLVFASDVPDKLDSQNNDGCYNCQNVRSFVHKKTSFYKQRCAIKRRIGWKDCLLKYSTIW